MKVKTPAREIIKPYVDKGMSIQEIVGITGIKYTTVQAARLRLLDKPGSKKKSVDRKKGWNKDRHACKLCQYRLSRTWVTRLQAKCNYLECIGKRRPCKVEDCNVFQKGKILIGKAE